MKPLQLRVRPPAQTDLFDSTSPPPALTSLELHHDELVDLLSQLLWQVANNEGALRSVENSDEQDQP